MRRILRGTFGVFLLSVLTYGAVPLFSAPSAPPTESLLLYVQRARVLKWLLPMLRAALFPGMLRGLMLRPARVSNPRFRSL